MSITNQNVVNKALREINVIAETRDASAEQGRDTIDKLNQMMEHWSEICGIDIGYYPQKSTSGTCPIPLYAEAAVISNLAVMCAPQYGASISPELAGKADSTYRGLLSKAIREQLDNADMSHLPPGAGNEGIGVKYNIQSDIES